MIWVHFRQETDFRVFEDLAAEDPILVFAK